MKRYALIVALIVISGAIIGGTSAIAQVTVARETAVVERPTVNVRLGPRTDSDLLGQAVQGQEFPVIAKTRNWVKIHHPTYGDGWIYLPLVTIRTPPVVAPNPVVEEDNAQPETPGTVVSTSSRDWVLPVIVTVLVLVLILTIALTAGRGDQHLLHHHL
ncbi:MAG TPA: SH3 domain-containing protein [candidate division Zixibacteria bacterium]|jgi:hypothetical protein